MSNLKKMLLAIVQPLLYRSLGDSFVCNFHKLLLLLVKRPDLRKLIRRLDSRCFLAIDYILRYVFEKARSDLGLPAETIEPMAHLGGRATQIRSSVAP